MLLRWSALVTGRPYSTELREFLAQSPEMPMGTSTIGFIETVRTIDQVGSYPTAMQDLVAAFTEILVTDENQGLGGKAAGRRQNARRHPYRKCSGHWR